MFEKSNPKACNNISTHFLSVLRELLRLGEYYPY